MNFIIFIFSYQPLRSILPVTLQFPYTSTLPGPLIDPTVQFFNINLEPYPKIKLVLLC